MTKLHLKELRPDAARIFRYLVFPRELLDNTVYSDLDDGAKLLYTLMLERANWSARNLDKYSDEDGRMYIIYTVEDMQRDLQRSRPTIVKLTKQLVDKGLIVKVRQGQGKPTKIYVMDFTSAPHDEPEKPTSKGCEPQEVKSFNFKKSKGFTSKSKETELLEVKDFNTIELNNKDLENNEPDPTYPPADWKDGWTDESLDVEEMQAQVRDQIEYTVLCENYDEEIADEVVEIITEVRCRDSPKMKIGSATYPMDFVRQRMESVRYEHVEYALDSLGRAGPVRNIHHYLLAVLFNAPASCNAAVQAVYNAKK